jgi:hypothetical protein
MNDTAREVNLTLIDAALAPSARAAAMVRLGMARARLAEGAADLPVALQARAKATPTNGRANGIAEDVKRANNPMNAAKGRDNMGNKIVRTRRGETELVTEIDGDSGYYRGGIDQCTGGSETEQHKRLFVTTGSEGTVGAETKHRETDVMYHGNATVGIRISPCQGHNCYTV